MRACVCVWREIFDLVLIRVGKCLKYKLYVPTLINQLTLNMDSMDSFRVKYLVITIV